MTRWWSSWVRSRFGGGDSMVEGGRKPHTTYWWSFWARSRFGRAEWPDSRVPGGGDRVGGVRNGRR